jgi:hypothetical protein
LFVSALGFLREMRSMNANPGGPHRRQTAG